MNEQVPYSYVVRNDKKTYTSYVKQCKTPQEAKDLKNGLTSEISEYNIHAEIHLDGSDLYIQAAQEAVQENSIRSSLSGKEEFESFIDRYGFKKVDGPLDLLVRKRPLNKPGKQTQYCKTFDTDNELSNCAVDLLDIIKGSLINAKMTTEDKTLYIGMPQGEEQQNVEYRNTLFSFEKALQDMEFRLSAKENVNYSRSQLQWGRKP